MSRRLIAIVFVVALAAVLFVSLRPKSEPAHAEAPVASTPGEGVIATRSERDTSGTSSAMRAAAASAASPSSSTSEHAPVVASESPAKSETVLVVRVQSSHGETPVEGAIVRAIARGAPPKPAVVKAAVQRGRVGDVLVSDARGEVEFMCEPGVALEVSISGRDVATAQKETVPELASGERRVVTLSLASGAKN